MTFSRKGDSMTNQNRKSGNGSIGSIFFLAVLLVISLNAGRAKAQDVDTTRSGADSTVTPGANLPCWDPEKYRKVSVTDAYRSTRTGEGEPQPKVGRLGDEITVVVEGLPVLLQKAQCTNPAKKIVLFLDGRPLKDVTPFPPSDPENKLLVFPLKRTESAREVWTFILGEPKWSLRNTGISVGLEDEFAVTSTASIELEAVPHGWFIFWAILFALLVIGFLALAVKSDVLRDSGPPPPGGARKAYSLARVQGAWWFFIILASYLLIGMITGDFSTSITGTVLILLGISVGTVVASGVIDAGKDGAAAAGAAPAPGAPAVAPPAAPPPAAPNEYWWLDILSDANGVSFPRFQNAVWTLVLGIIFATQVYKVLAMPTFDAALLGLMGISAGGYLAMKIPESE